MIDKVLVRAHKMGKYPREVFLVDDGMFHSQLSEEAAKGYIAYFNDYSGLLKRYVANGCNPNMEEWVK